MICSFVFFFQAEDGIRDLVRSRGLGDVYKRQAIIVMAFYVNGKGLGAIIPAARQWPKPTSRSVTPVSYTHLTLPTSDLV